jgi:chemotaxis protein CheD
LGSWTETEQQVERTMKLIVGVSDMIVSKDPEAEIITYSLGSCIGIAVYDAVANVGGLLHFMLPDSNLDLEKAKRKPFMFADTGIPALFKSAYQLGAAKQRMRVIVTGGSQVLDQKGFFNIGKRNDMAVRKIFHKNNVIINYRDVGGNVNRTVRVLVKTGDITIKVSGQGEQTI